MDFIEFSALKNRLQTLGSLNIRIISDSMQPLIRINEELVVMPLPDKIIPFDLIVFLDQDKLICHFLWQDQKDFDQTIITRSLKEFYTNETPTPYNHILGYIREKKIPWYLRFKIIALNFLKF